MLLPHLDTSREILVGLAGLGAGLVNGVAGGGSLVSFPALLAVGYPALAANVTSTVGIWPGYLGGSAAFRKEIGAQRDRLRELAATVVVGGIVGGVLILTTPTSVFKLVAPYLVLFACALFAVQPLVVRKVRVSDPTRSSAHRLAMHAGAFVASVYGAYFGAGLGVVFLGVLGLSMSDTLVRVNGLRSILSLMVNTVAALIFIVSAPVAWTAAGLMAGSSLAGGYVGARVARRVPAPTLRVVVVLLGIVTSARLLGG